MKNLGYYNGKIAELENLNIPILDRAVYFGDAVFDATYADYHYPFALKEHLDRFYKSADYMGIIPDFSKDYIEVLIKELIKLVDSEKQFVYWQISRGSGIREHNFTGKPNIMIMIYPKSIVPINKGYNVTTLEDKRYLYCNAKTINLMPNILGSIMAGKLSCDEAIFLRDGIVTEGLHSNVHIIKNGTLITPLDDNRILQGVARIHLINACKSLGLEVIKRNIAEIELFDCDRILFTSSGGLCVSVDTINGQRAPQNENGIVDSLKQLLYKEFEESTKNGL